MASISFHQRIDLGMADTKFGSMELNRHQYLNIRPESTLLAASQTLEQEIEIMKYVFEQQIEVLQSFMASLKRLYERSQNNKDEGASTTTSSRNLTPSTLGTAAETINSVKARVSKLTKLQSVAIQTATKVSVFLS